MDISVSRIVGESFSTAVKNVASILGASILWVVTCWIPYINVGTTIALFYGLPIELSKGRVMNPVAIFDGKYRKYMGEFFSCVGLMMLSIIPAFLFMVVPAIIISIGWIFAVILLIDKEMNPAEAMTASTRYTYGYKWTIFFSQLIVTAVAYVIALILMSIVGTIDVGFITLIVGIFSMGLILSIGVSFNGVMYKLLVVERTEPLPTNVE